MKPETFNTWKFMSIELDNFARTLPTKKDDVLMQIEKNPIETPYASPMPDSLAENMIKSLGTMPPYLNVNGANQ